MAKPCKGIAIANNQVKIMRLNNIVVSVYHQPGWVLVLPLERVRLPILAKIEAITSTRSICIGPLTPINSL